MKKTLYTLAIASIALLGVNFAHAATYTLTRGGGEYAYYSVSSPIPAGIYYTQIPTPPLDQFVESDVGGFASTDLGNGWSTFTTTAPATCDPVCYFWSGDMPMEAGATTTITTIAPVIPAAISFFLPTNGATIPSNFYNWQVTLKNVTSTQLYRIDVEYQQFGGGTTYDDFNLVTPTYPDALIGNTHAYLATGATSVSYSATAYLTTNTSTDFFIAETDPGSVISSSTIFFTIGVSSSTPSSTFLSVCPTAPPIFQIIDTLPWFQINNPVPSIISGGCNILAAGFIMSDTQSAEINSRYANAAAVISVKPPLGYFTIITGAFGSFASGSSSISLLPSASSTAALSPIFTPLDDGIAACIGLLGGFWLLRRLKHIQP